ncbi:MAG: hypothetical protein IKW67_00405 [Alphaproteobacteria bacterium]|nr:hypothetical protein [Alphaproteobacteria bacterium]
MKKKTKFCFILIITFFVGCLTGAFVWHNRNVFSFSELPMCEDGNEPDKNGCCLGEIYTDMNDLGFNCCPEVGGDCFPPLR